MAKRAGTVAFTCFQNAKRSILGEALFNKYADPSKAVAVSFASDKAPEKIYPDILSVLQEVGIDYTDRVPQPYSQELYSKVDLVVAFGNSQQLPKDAPTQPEVVSWNHYSKVKEDLEGFRALRDSIQADVIKLLGENGWAK